MPMPLNIIHIILLAFLLILFMRIIVSSNASNGKCGCSNKKYAEKTDLHADNFELLLTNPRNPSEVTETTYTVGKCNSGFKQSSCMNGNCSNGFSLKDEEYCYLECAQEPDDKLRKECNTKCMEMITLQ